MQRTTSQPNHSGWRRYLNVPPAHELPRRLPPVVLGLWLFGVGIAMMIAGDLGLAPWDVFHVGVGEVAGIDVGTVIILVGLVVVLGFFPLGERLGLGTILNAILIGVAVNVTTPLLGDPSGLGWRLLLTIFGPVVVAIGSGLYIGGGLGPGPRDGIMTGLANRGIPIAKARTAIELVVLVAGLLLTRDITLLGLGTLWFTFGIGPMVGFFLPRMTLAATTPSTNQ